MAVNLTAVFKVRDQGTSTLRKLTQQLDRMNGTSKKVSSSLEGATSGVSRFGNATNGLRNKVSSASSSLGGLLGTLTGVAGAYITAQGAAKAFESTIGAAAKYEQSEVAIKAIFNDADASAAYLQLVDQIAIDSPLLNSGDIIASSKGIVAMTKDVQELGKAWQIVEKLLVLDPTQGTEGAAFALKELFQGNSLSLTERFGLNKGELNRIKKLNIPQQIIEINKLLDQMGITQDTVNSIGQTTLGYWAQIQERVDKFTRSIGASSNSRLGAELAKIVALLDTIDTDKLAAQVGDRLALVVDNVIKVGKFLIKWREPLAYAVGAVTAALGAFAIVGAVTALANPVTLIAAGIAAAAVGFKALYDNAQPVRSAIGAIVEKVRGLYDAFKTDGTSGILNAILPPGVVEDISARFATVKEQFINAFTAIQNIVVPILQAAWGLIQPILSALFTALKIVADVALIAWNNVLAPAITFIGEAFTAMWAIVSPILELLGAAIEVAFGVLRLAWETIVGPFITFLSTIFTSVFGAATEVVSALSPVFETLGGWISQAAGYLKTFADLIGKIKVPDWIGELSTRGVQWAKNLLPGGGGRHSNYHGIENVPYDGYQTTLHKGERVLTRQENAEGNQSNKGFVVSVTGNTFNVRKESDIDAIADKLAIKLMREAAQRG